MLGLARYDGDRAWVQDYLLDGLDDPARGVRYAAVVAMGEPIRRTRTIDARTSAGSRISQLTPIWREQRATF